MNNKKMRTIFIIILTLHALIHLIGFLKGFQLVNFPEFTVSISKSDGLIWLGAILVLMTAGIFYFFEHPHWWLFGITGAFISQMLIIPHWADAKYASFPNLIILVVALIAFSQFRFEQKADKEIDGILENAEKVTTPKNPREMLEKLPHPVQKWLIFSGILEKDSIGSVYIAQNYLIKLKPEQKEWFPTKAEQYSTISPPAFVWTADMKMMPLVYAFGRDKFIDGQGEMLFKLLSLFPVAKDGYNPQFNESALQRFLGEMVWYPSAAVLPYIHWEEIDENTAKATLTYQQTSGTGTFHFDEEGKLQKFVADRYMGSRPNAPKIKWIVNIEEHRKFDGLHLPSKGSLTWKLDSGDWTWAQFEITEVKFNPNQ